MASLENRNQRKLISVIIPTLNEEEGIVKTLKSIPYDILRKMGYDVEIIVVDGGSTDRTRELAASLGARVILEPRKGYGRAYLTGFKHAKGDIIVTADGDGTYPLDKLHVYIYLLEKMNLDFINVNRMMFHSDGAFYPVNKVGNRLINFFLKLLYPGIPIRDSQSGMWVFRRKLLNDMRLSATGMEFSTEIKLEAWRVTKRVAEFPGYYRRRLGESKLDKFKDGSKIVLFIVRKRIWDYLTSSMDLSIWKKLVLTVARYFKIFNGMLKVQVSSGN